MKESDGNEQSLRTSEKKECDYGERCYRKNPSHFQEYQHQHLTNLLTTLERSGRKTLPPDFKANISKETINQQLNILRSFKTSSSLNSGKTSTIAQDGGSGSGSAKKRQSSCKDSNENEGKKPQLLNNETRKQTNSNSGQIKDSSNMAGTLSSAEHHKKMQEARNMSEAMSYFQEVKKRSQRNICKKHESAAPYYFFLTSVTDSRETHIEPLSLQLFDILDPSLGDLESSLQINFMVEFGWLMAQYHVAKQGGKPLTLLYGDMDVANLSMKHVTAVHVKPPSPFGSHHTKMCVMAYKDCSVRVAVHTANLVESDWDNRVQGLWLSPLCPSLPLDADTTAGDSPTGFKRDLIQYLQAYRLPELQPWVGKLRRADFSQINVFFVASTPGSHKDGDCDRWGHTRLASLLKQHVQIPPRSGWSPSAWPIIAQCSSIGSLGPQPTSWFCGQIKQTMSSGLGQALQSPPPIKLVYPSFENVASSYDGLMGGGCLPYSSKTHDKQPWLQQYLYQWKCECRHRTRAMPHIKTYTRVSPDLSQLAWFHLTSANLSKAAWGNQNKSGGLSILSYEAGVLFLPKFVLGSHTLPLNATVAGDAPIFPLPYDLPLTQYSSRDVPWFIDSIS